MKIAPIQDDPQDEVAKAEWMRRNPGRPWPYEYRPSSERHLLDSLTSGESTEAWLLLNAARTGQPLEDVPAAAILQRRIARNEERLAVPRVERSDADAWKFDAASWRAARDAAQLPTYADQDLIAAAELVAGTPASIPAAEPIGHARLSMSPSGLTQRHVHKLQRLVGPRSVGGFAATTRQWGPAGEAASWLLRYLQGPTTWSEQHRMLVGVRDWMRSQGFHRTDPDAFRALQRDIGQLSLDVHHYEDAYGRPH